MRHTLIGLALLSAVGCQSGVAPEMSADARVRESLADLPVSRVQASIRAATPAVQSLTAAGKNQTAAQGDSLRRVVNRFYPEGTKEAYVEHFRLVYNTDPSDIQDAKLRAHVERAQATMNQVGGLETFIETFMANK